MKYLHKPGFAKLFSLAIALVMSVNMGGCYNTAGAQSGLTETTQTEAPVITSETSITTTAQSNNKDEEIPDYLPDGITMDELLNGIQINGKTLTLPTTINDILALDDRFSFEIHDTELYSSYEEGFENYGSVGYDIKIDNNTVFYVDISKDNYTGDIKQTPIYILGSFTNSNFLGNDVGFKYLSQFDFDSTYSQINLVLGKPAYVSTYGAIYEFRSKKYIYKVKIGSVDEDFLTGKGNISHYDISLLNTENS